MDTEREREREREREKGKETLVPDKPFPGVLNIFRIMSRDHDADEILSDSVEQFSERSAICFVCVLVALVNGTRVTLVNGSFSLLNHVRTAHQLCRKSNLLLFEKRQTTIKDVHCFLNKKSMYQSVYFDQTLIKRTSIREGTENPWTDLEMTSSWNFMNVDWLKGDPFGDLSGVKSRKL